MRSEQIQIGHDKAKPAKTINPWTTTLASHVAHEDVQCRALSGAAAAAGDIMMMRVLTGPHE